MKGYKKQHGLSRRLHPYQIMSYLVVLVKLGVFSAIILPVNPLPASVS